MKIFRPRSSLSICRFRHFIFLFHRCRARFLKKNSLPHRGTGNLLLSRSIIKILLVIPVDHLMQLIFNIFLLRRHADLRRQRRILRAKNHFIHRSHRLTRLILVSRRLVPSSTRRFLEVPALAAFRISLAVKIFVDRPRLMNFD